MHRPPNNDLPAPPSVTLVSIVDDDAFVRGAMSSLVRSIGWEAVAFPAASEFLASQEAKSSQCLVCDIEMPGIGGIELLENLRNDGHPVPTIFITAHLADRVRDRASAAGALCVMEKPIDSVEFEGWLSLAVHGRVGPDF